MLRRFLVATLLSVLGSAGLASAQSGVTRYVNHTDTTCGGHSPCYATIQAAVNAAQPGDTIQIQAGAYVEQVLIAGKNNTSSATEASRILIRADPAAPLGSVTLRGAVTQCTQGYAIQLQQSRYITIRGLTITGAGGQAVSLLGGNNQSSAVHIERNWIVGNGSSSCNGGITIASGNPGTLIVNNLISGNGRNGIATIDADGGPHDIMENTIHGNGWSGVSVTRNHQVLLANNAITGNGTTSGSTGGRFGVIRESSSTPNPAGIQLLDNLICGNRLGEISGPALDTTDVGNLTPTGTEGPGVSASPGCENPATVYANVTGLDHLANTVDDDFTPAPGSPLIDRGLDPRTLGLPSSFNPPFEADFAADAARPKAGVVGGAPRFDIGAIEVAPPDTQPPTISFLQPAASAFVRGTVTVSAQATDSGGVASLALRADNQTLTATLTPPPPASSTTATATWNTTTFADGTHTLTAVATDVTGNSTSGQRAVIVDNTPPDTQISGGPSGTITSASATFTFTGTDNVSATANLVFAWRLDGGAFSAFSSATTATFSALTAASHTFEVKARDQAGNEDLTPAQRSFTISPLTVTITDPSAGATVAAGTIVVQGTVQAGSAEVGVVVNGVAAALQGTTFAALVSVSQTATTLTATATATSGATATRSITITVGATGGATLTLDPNPAAGVAPLTVAFSVFGALAPLSIALDYDGNGTDDFSGPTLDGHLFTYTQPGVYAPRATITDAQGNRFVAKALVEVFDRAAFDGSLQSKWRALRDALRQANISQALDLIAAAVRDGYQEALTALTVPPSQIDTVLTDITFVDLDEGRAEYQMIRVDDGVAISHFVLVVKDGDGIWRLKFF